jgi:hypothetical protein
LERNFVDHYLPPPLCSSINPMGIAFFGVGYNFVICSMGLLLGFDGWEKVPSNSSLQKS